MLIACQRIYTCNHKDILISSSFCWVVSSIIVISKVAAMQMKWSRGVKISSTQRTEN